MLPFTNRISMYVEIPHLFLFLRLFFFFLFLIHEGKFYPGTRIFQSLNIQRITPSYLSAIALLQFSISYQRESHNSEIIHIVSIHFHFVRILFKVFHAIRNHPIERRFKNLALPFLLPFFHKPTNSNRACIYRHATTNTILSRFIEQDDE